MSAQQATSGVQQVTSDAKQVMIDNLTSVPTDVFEEFRKAGKKARASGQHRLVKNSKGQLRLMNASVVEGLEKHAIHDAALKTDASSKAIRSSFLDRARVTSTPKVFSSMARMFGKQVSNPDMVSTAKGPPPAVLVATTSESTLASAGGPRLARAGRGGSLGSC